MHRNTKLTPYTRERMVMEHNRGEKVKVLVGRYGISRTAFYRCRKRFLLEGREGLKDRTSRPHRVRYKLIPSQVDELVELRLSKGLGPLRLAPLVEAPASTIYRCLRRRGLGRLPRPLRPAVVRYEAKAPGELIHLDVLHLFALKGQKPVYQFTVVDDYTRLAYAVIAPRRTTQAALEAVEKAQLFFQFPI